MVPYSERFLIIKAYELRKGKTGLSLRRRDCDSIKKKADYT
jgi:hypothetical protein